jgi:glycosyltransferase involved in cell wall biosynthesis
MKKIAIVMTYFDRQFQLERTLKSIKTSHTDFEVIIVDDNSPKPIIVPETNFPVFVHRFRDKIWNNSEPVYNTGIIHALRHGAEIIIVQNAECFHIGDVIEYASHVTDEKYISFGCYSIDEQTTFEDHNVHSVIRANDYGASRNGQNAWYNHPIHRPVGYDFCAAMTRTTMMRLNGYDERLSAGYAYGDNYLIDRVKMLGLQIEITTNPIVVHQWHYSKNYKPKNWESLMEKNRVLYHQLLTENNPRAVHYYTTNFNEL